MVRNTMGGKKAKKMKNGGPVKRETEYATEDQYYAVVEKFHSHSNIDVCFVDKDEDSNDFIVSAIGVLRGKIIKRIKRVAIGDFLIISKRDFATVKTNKKQIVDILHKYNDIDKNKIASEFPELLKSYYNNQTDKSNKNKSVNTNLDNEDDEIIFQRKQNEKAINKKKRLAGGPRSNTVTNDYLAGFDLPESDDGFTTDDEPFEGTDEEYQTKLINSI